MSKVFLVADPYFFTPEAAAKFNMTIEEYNNTIITNLLTTMDVGDEFLFFGELGYGSLAALQDLLAPLNPTETCSLIDGREQTHFSQQTYKEMFHKVWNAPGIHRGTYDKKFYTFLISPAKFGMKFDLEQRGESTYVVTTESKYETGCRFKDKVFNAAVEFNDLKPVALVDLPRIVHGIENS